VINGMHHTALSTPDAERLIQFYRDVIGFDLIWDDTWGDSDTADSILGLPQSRGSVAMLKAGNAFLEIFQFDSPEGQAQTLNRPVSDHGITHIALDVTDIDSEYRRLVDAGMQFHTPPIDMEMFGVRTTYGRDPDGNVVEVQEILDPASRMKLPHD
jgi:catechol 2,3-dioxygenase-like lactoylglutathione lyase family enzyme